MNTLNEIPLATIDELTAQEILRAHNVLIAPDDNRPPSEIARVLGFISTLEN